MKSQAKRARVRGAPTARGLRTRYVAVERHDRLVEDAELVFVDGAPQLSLELETGKGLRIEDGVEQLRRAASSLFRPVHGEVGVAQQLVRARRGVGCDRDPDACAGCRSRPRSSRAPKRLDDPVRQEHDITRIVEVLCDDHEFVTADASDGVSDTDTERMPRPAIFSISSPATWPRLSLTTLKRSMSSIITAARPGLRSRRATAVRAGLEEVRG